jgi:hypothetical protein
MNDAIKGKGAVGIAISYFSLRGMVSIPLEPCSYNLIFDETCDMFTIPKRIKVISCCYKTQYGVFSASIRTSGGNQPNTKIKEFSASSCDYLFVVTSELDMYNIPSNEISAKRQISLNVYDKYKVNLIAL